MGFWSTVGDVLIFGVRMFGKFSRNQAADDVSFFVLDTNTTVCSLWRKRIHKKCALIS